MKNTIILLAFTCLTACTTTKSSKIKTTYWVHAEKQSSIADYHACIHNTPDNREEIESTPEYLKIVKPKYRHLGTTYTGKSHAEYEQSIDKCLKEHGWKRKMVQGNKKVTNDERHKIHLIPDCLEKSKVENKIDHKLMNQCLNEET